MGLQLDTYRRGIEQCARKCRSSALPADRPQVPVAGVFGFGSGLSQRAMRECPSERCDRSRNCCRQAGHGRLHTGVNRTPGSCRACWPLRRRTGTPRMRVPRAGSDVGPRRRTALGATGAGRAGLPFGCGVGQTCSGWRRISGVTFDTPSRCPWPPPGPGMPTVQSVSSWMTGVPWFNPLPVVSPQFQGSTRRCRACLDLRSHRPHPRHAFCVHSCPRGSL